MSQVHFVVYALADGSVRRSGTCQDYDLAKQAGDGEGVMEATADAIIVAEVNLDPVKASASTAIDEAAESVRGWFITPGSGQAMTYLIKQQEALAFAADNSASVPMLAGEAAALGLTVAQLVATVSAQATAWLTIGGKIEGVRRAAKIAVEAVTNVKDIHAAMQVDWNAVLA